MRIAVVNNFYYPWRGGEEVHCKNLAENLVSDGHHVEVYCSSLPLHPGYRIQEGVIVHGHRTFGLFFGVPVCPSIFFSLVKCNCDLIQAEFPNPAFAFFAALAGSLKGKPVVLTYHNDLPPVTPAAKVLVSIHDRLFARVYFRMFSAIITTTSIYSKGSSLLKTFNPLVIRNGVDLNKFTPKPGGDYALFVAAMGRWHRYKGLHVLLKAYRNYVDMGGIRPLKIVGEGTEKKRYEALASDLGLFPRVEFLGEVPDSRLPELYQKAGLYVSASLDRSEGFGLTVLEAMSSGLPVIATNVGGLPELVKDGVNGFLVEPGNPAQLAQAMIKLDDRDLSLKMGVESRKIAEKMSWKTMTSSYEQLYAKLTDPPNNLRYDEKNIYAVIPAKNEQDTIASVVSGTKKYAKFVIVVNDGSSDLTLLKARSAGAIVISHPLSLGAGAATSTGMRYALNKGATVIVTLDGDGQHDPSYIPSLVIPIIEGKADVVIGSRDLTNAGFLRRFANKLLSVEVATVSGAKISDSQSGFRVYSRRAAEIFVEQVSEWGYGWASESAVVMARNHLRLMECPITAKPHRGKKGTRWWDGFLIFYHGLRAALRRSLKC